MVLADRGDLHVAVDGDLRVALDVGAEHGFQRGLGEHVHLRESVGGADLCTARNLGQHVHLWVDQPKTVPWPAMDGELLADTQPGQDAKHLVVSVHRPRRRVDGLVAVQHQCFDTVLAQQGRGGDAGRAGTDDHNRNEFRQAVLLRGHLYTTTLRWTPRSMAPSSVAMLASTTSPSCRYAGFFSNCAVRNAPRSMSPLGVTPCRVSAVPTGVPVNRMSPASTFWNFDSACSACTGGKRMSPSMTMSWRTSPLTDSRSRSSPKRLSSSASTSTSA